MTSTLRVSCLTPCICALNAHAAVETQRQQLCAKGSLALCLHLMLNQVPRGNRLRGCMSNFSTCGYSIISSAASAGGKVRPARRQSASVKPRASGGDALKTDEGASAAAVTTVDPVLACTHLLLPIMDRNPYLTESTKQVMLVCMEETRRFWQLTE